MAIQFSFLTNGYMGPGYSIAVIGVGDAGQEALFTLNLPMYCDDTFSLARMVYVNDDKAIKRGEASEPPCYVEEYTEGTWPSTREKDDPLHPCKVCDWIFLLADLKEEGSIETIKKCAAAHTQQANDEKKLICITYVDDEKLAKESLGETCNLLILTEKQSESLMRPVELILFDMYAGLVTMIDKGDVVRTLDKCNTMYHRYADFCSMEEAEKVVESIKAELQKVDRGENTIHAIVAGKGCSPTGDYEYAASELASYFWKADDVAVFQNKPTSKSIKSYVSLLYGLAPFEERSMLQAVNLWYEELRKEHPGEDVIELNLSDLQ